MLKKRTLFTLLLLTGFAVGLWAQSAKLKRAKRLMENLAYTEAIEQYNQILEKEDNAEAKINIAEAYRKVNDPENAEYWYGQVVRLPEAEPIHNLYYGQMLQRNGKCDLAKEWYDNYTAAVPDDERGQLLSRACDYEDELMTKNSGIFTINHLDINSSVDDMSPAMYKDGLVFASERDQGVATKRTGAWTGRPFLELYYVEARDNSSRDTSGQCTFIYSRPTKFTKDLNSKFNDGMASFSEDESEVFFTRNNVVGGKTETSDEGLVKLKVFYASHEDDDDWGELQSLPFNSDEYSVAHPALASGGEKLYFASDMPGGFGGMDLYVSEKESGRWGPPMNLGPTINTEGNELFPYFANNGERLYFTSDGQIGLGGLDIYYSEDRGNGEWSTPENMGFPINTIADDFGIVFNKEGTCGYFTSDRIGGAGRDDIYSFVKQAAPVQILVYDAITNEPLEQANVVNSCTGNTLITGANGKITIDQKLNECCSFTANLEGYLENTQEGCTTNLGPGEEVIVEIPLSRKLEFEITGIVFDQDSGLPMDGATVTLTNDCEEEEVEPIVTDASGRYTFKLQKDCCYKVKATKENYLAAWAEGQCTKGLEGSETLTANLYLQSILTSPSLSENEGVITRDGDGPRIDGEGPTTNNEKSGTVYEPALDPTTGLYLDPVTGDPAEGPYGEYFYENGERVEKPGFDVNPNPSGLTAFMLHVYYDFDQSYIREEAESELEKLYTTLEENSTYIIEIGSHTDSRGSDRYNTRLSQRRAEAIVRWLADRGIDRTRLVAKGYGETMNVNDCVNNVPCSEEKHQLNRRTEFRVIGNTISGSILISEPNPSPDVVGCEGCPF